MPAAVTTPSELTPLQRAAALDELADLVAPPGRGIYTFSSGHADAITASQRYLGGKPLDWRAAIEAALIPDGVALLAIPSDTGAGLVRGAARGPEGIRAALRRAPCPELGDVRCIQHLLDEASLAEAARHRCQDALYPKLEESARRRRPVTPLGMAKRAVSLAGQLAPGLRVCMLGGDHTVTWPVLDALLSPRVADNRDVGIVHFDAHTDLLPERQGVPYCFATWAWHANERIGGDQRLVQLGIRVSAHPREHWERTCSVVQRWGDSGLDPEALGAWVVAHLRARGVRRVYVSNDIDGTDARWAAACGTPEPGGLTPDHVLAVLDALTAATDLIPLGGDVVEVAPGLSLDAEASERTCALAADYVRATLRWLGRDDVEPEKPPE
jgi:agmatinase